MFPPREFWDRLPAWHREFLYRYEADLPRMQAEHDALPRLTQEQVAKVRYLLHGTPGTSRRAERGSPMIATQDTPALTDADRHTIAKARELAGLRAATVREFTGEENLDDAYVVAFGRAQFEIGQLLDIIGRLDGAR